MADGRGARCYVRVSRKEVEKKALIRPLMAFNGTIVGAPEHLLCHCPMRMLPCGDEAKHSGLLMRLLKHRDIHRRRRQRHSSPVKEVFM